MVLIHLVIPDLIERQTDDYHQRGDRKKTKSDHKSVKRFSVCSVFFSSHKKPLIIAKRHKVLVPRCAGKARLPTRFFRYLYYDVP